MMMTPRFSHDRGSL